MRPADCKSRFAGIFALAGGSLAGRVGLPRCDRRVEHVGSTRVVAGLSSREYSEAGLIDRSPPPARTQRGSVRIPAQAPVARGARPRPAARRIAGAVNHVARPARGRREGRRLRPGSVHSDPYARCSALVPRPRRAEWRKFPQPLAQTPCTQAGAAGLAAGGRAGSWAVRMPGPPRTPVEAHVPSSPATSLAP
jgi:hypothetical protein